MSDLSSLVLDNLILMLNSLVLMLASFHFLNPKTTFSLKKVLLAIVLFLLVSGLFLVYTYKLPLDKTMINVLLPTSKSYYSYLTVIYLLASFALMTPLLRKVVEIMPTKIYLYLLLLYIIKTIPNLLYLLGITTDNFDISYTNEIVSMAFLAYMLGYFLHHYQNKIFYQAIALAVLVILIAQIIALRINYPSLTKREFLENVAMFFTSITIVRFFVAILLFKLISKVGLLNE